MSEVFKETSDKLDAKIDSLKAGCWIEGFNLCEFWDDATKLLGEAEECAAKRIFTDNLETLVVGFCELVDHLWELKSTICELAENDEAKRD
jgi:hypothetical protein